MCVSGCGIHACVCMYLCMDVCMHGCYILMCACIFLMNRGINVLVGVFLIKGIVCVCRCMSVWVCTYVYICMYRGVCMWVYTYVYLCTRVCRVHVHMWVCKSVFICIICVWLRVTVIGSVPVIQTR